jgi:hypothetical protein
MTYPDAIQKAISLSSMTQFSPQSVINQFYPVNTRHLSANTTTIVLHQHTITSHRHSQHANEDVIGLSNIVELLCPLLLLILFIIITKNPSTKELNRNPAIKFRVKILTFQSLINYLLRARYLKRAPRSRRPTF